MSERGVGGLLRRRAIRAAVHITIAVSVVGPLRAAVTRDDDPVVVSAAVFPELQGDFINQIALFHYDAATDTFSPIPFQVDQKVDHVFSPGTQFQVTERMYDVFGEDDGHLDALDEIVFLYPDAGDQTPVCTSWVQGADPDRYEIRVSDPRPGGPYPDKYVYLFTGIGLPKSQISYISWQVSRQTAMSSTRFDLDFTDRWLLTGYHVNPPCGSGADLIDRVKGRAGLAVDRAESEELWNPTSTFLGGIVGPVRAIRYIRGAASGVNTIHHDVFYRGFWERVVNLRVHPVSGIWFYFDLKAGSGATFIAPDVPAGVAVDGANDPSVPSALKPWTIVKGPDGGFAVMYDTPSSPFVGSSTFYYRDDAGFNDKSITESSYTDEDDSAYGDQGLHLDSVSGQETDTITMGFRTYPLCSNVGDATMGAQLRELYDYPLATEATLQSRETRAIRDVQMAKVGADLVVSWTAITNAVSYKVYASTSPNAARPDWTLVGEPTVNGFVNTGALGDPTPRYYSVTAVTAMGEGPW